MALWDRATHTCQAILDTKVGRYLIKKEKYGSYCAYLNNVKTEFRGETEDQVKSQVDQFVESYHV